ncbi:hypothetical protein [Hymenobacter sp. AT01-02]|uniref:hypothetical protein n=1 Tax=Hymenobacter sp. AT01-02 TaxID=1571877 RepID=UPI0006E3D088|nr:hypothetical protein [Hymenobacter sp. AT01-02]
MNKRYLSGLLIAFVVLDLIYTYWQNYQLPLDGDIVPTILPAQWFSKVLHDPFGWAVLTRNEVYGGTNRFFAHATMGLYLKRVPHLLQYFIPPIASLYTATALFNTATQALLTVLLACYIRLGAGGPRAGWSFWVAVALLVPLFQTSGFYEQMGITNYAITYTFFYAFPMALLLVVWWPIFQAVQRQQPLHLRPWQLALLVALIVVISFNGPITVAAIAILLLGISLYWLAQQWQNGLQWPSLRAIPGNWLSGQVVVLLATMGVLGLYSLYIGRNNAENTHTHTLGELYQLLPTGVYLELTLHWGLPVLIVLVLVNVQLVYRFTAPSLERQRVLNSIRWVGLFACAFILLLPFGGYRDYRAYLVRGDSILPVLLALFYAYGLSSYFLVLRLSGQRRHAYIALIVLFAATFTYMDVATKLPVNNDCERWSMDQIAQSSEPVVRISPYCNVLTWSPVPDYHQSELQAEMLYYWGVTKSKKFYYQ